MPGVLVTADTDESEDVIRWRFDYAHQLGFTPDECWALAKDTTDLHAIEALVLGGCSPDVAAAIVR